MDKLLQGHHTMMSVRSLLWSFGSPSLIAASKDERWQSDEWCSWRALELAGLIEKPELAAQLDQFLDAENDHRLGARFERLIEFGLNYLPGVECIERRLQVYKRKQTRGEFDFIVKDLASGKLEHWEVASKFYLGVPSSSMSRSTDEAAALHWVGPGKRDSLVRKLNHLTQKQLLLSSLPESRTTLEALGADVERVRALLKGRLFYPLTADHVHDASFRFGDSEHSLTLNPHAPFGFWCDFDQLARAKPQSIYSLQKTQWLDPATDQGQPLDVQQLEAQVQSTPQCVDVVTEHGQAQRWFVVSKGWFDDLDPKAIS